MSLVSKPQRAPLFCYVTDLRAIFSPESANTSIPPESANAREALLEKIAAAAAAGVDWIQIREKHLTAKECSALVRDALERVAQPAAIGGAATRVLVNDRLDVALAAQAGGVHLAENSVPLHEAKRLARANGRENFLVGVSCHSLEAAKTAAQGGADYLFFGPVFATPSKAGYGAPQGLERLSEVCRAVSIPVLAIGGITLGNFTLCLSTGAAGIAAIRLFQDTSDLHKLFQSLRKTP